VKPKGGRLEKMNMQVWMHARNGNDQSCKGRRACNISRLWYSLNVYAHWVSIFLFKFSFGVHKLKSS
jgi:hypothetical protein